MSATNRVESLRQNVERMLEILSPFADEGSLAEGRRRLRKFLQKLGALSLAMPPTLEPRLEIELYYIIESHPKLRQASRVVRKLEFLEICDEGLSSYAALRSARALTTLELEQLRRIEGEHQRATEELDQMWQEFWGECGPGGIVS